MTDQPITRRLPLTADQVLAALDGRLTQVRVPVQNPPALSGVRPIACDWMENNLKLYGFCGEFVEWLSPFGGPGDLLWAPEATRSDCRLTFTVRGVRIERLQGISAEDCCNSGVLVDCTSCSGECDHLSQSVLLRRQVRRDFRMAWDIRFGHSGYGWGENPLVWVGEIKLNLADER
ncbi:MAG: hypothetical protein HQ582_06135 [Planctomycetes bacterium]|nr:hypothetical protein [Planctomycetota bacterium]